AHQASEAGVVGRVEEHHEVRPRLAHRAGAGGVHPLAQPGRVGREPGVAQDGGGVVVAGQHPGAVGGVVDGLVPADERVGGIGVSPVLGQHGAGEPRLHHQRGQVGHDTQDYHGRQAFVSAPRTLAMAAGGGLVLALSLPPWPASTGTWLLGVVGAALLFAAVDGRRLRARLGAGMAAGLGLYLPGLWWMRDFSLPGFVVTVMVESALLAGGAALVPARSRAGPV